MFEANKEIISVLKTRYPAKGELLNKLLEIVSVGKEALYRRLRGEIPFTLQETVTICQKLNISLDNVMNINGEDNYSFRLMNVFFSNKLKEYARMLNNTIEWNDYVKNDPKNINYRVHNTLPQDFAFRYEIICQLYLYIIYYQLNPNYHHRTFNSVKLPQNLLEIMKRTSESCDEVNSTVIMDEYSFMIFTESVRYCKGLGIFTPDNIEQIKDNLFLILNDLEQNANRGYTRDGKEFNLFISHTYLDASYFYTSGFDLESCAVRLYGIDYLSCQNKVICNRHKEWIESFMRFSTLISVSGEKTRVDYFRKQREIISSL